MSFFARLSALAIICIFSFNSTTAQSNCVPTNINGSVRDLLCNETCVSLQFQIPHLKNTDEYTFSTAPYSPYPYTHPTGVEDNILYADDQYSFPIDLPFPFCFYGAVYNKTVVGSNGLITFDIANADCSNAWPITQTIPFAGGSPCQSATTYYPRASIMAAYSDLDPRTTACPPGRKISWYTLGNAPCRKFVVSYFKIGVFGNNGCGTVTPNTFQIVIHESTGLVELFFEQKACLSSTNSGRAIMGIQNWDQNKAVAAPGKNNTTWSETNAGYRFIPSGGGSLYKTSRIYAMDGTLVGTADTATTTPGMLQLSFNNICPPPGSTQYRIVTEFTTCDNPNNVITSSDTITLNRTNGLNATATTTNTSCGPPSGTITVNVPAGTAPYSFVLDGGTPVSSGSPYTFTGVAAGQHTIVITDATGCTSTLTVDVVLNNNLQATLTPTNTSCPGANNGTLLVTPTSGTGPYTFTLMPGNVVMTGNTALFTGLSQALYTVTITDASGCSTNPALSATILAGPGITANITQTPVTCTGASNGTVTVTPTSGTPPFTFVLDGGAATQTGATATFPGLPAGPHTVMVTDNSGCSTNPILQITVLSGGTLTANVATNSTSCAGANNGSVLVTPTNGTGPYTFVLDGTVTQNGATNTTFINLAPGAHSVVVTDASGCVSNTINFNIATGSALTASHTETGTTCAGASNGTITVTPNNGSGPYTFVLNGSITQSGATNTTFNNVPAGNHTVVVTDAAGCVSAPINITIAAGPALTTTANHTDVLCNGGTTGTITVVQPAAGTAPYEYSLDGVTWQTSNVFNGLPAGTYTVYYKEANGCQNQLTKVIGQPTLLDANLSAIPVVCNAASNGTITVNASGGVGPYQYSIDGGTNWQTSNTFNVPAGSYTIITRDVNLCSTTDNINVSEPAVLTASAITTNATCNGGADGTITVTANGGNTSYTYSIDGNNYQSSNVFYVAGGTYTVTVRDNLGCTVTIPNVNVQMTNDLVFTPPATPTICEGTSTQLNIVSNANQYSWSPSTGLSNSTIANPVANPTVTTTYDLTLTLGLCSQTIPVTVNVNPAPVANAGTDGFICYGQSYNLQASGGVSYVWSPATYLSSTSVSNPVATPDRTTTYSVSVTDANGCTSLVTDQVTIDVTPPITVTTSPYDTIAYDGDQFQVTASSIGTSYVWSPSAGLSNPNIPNPIVTTGAIGDVVVYKVTASTQAGCIGEGFVRVQVYKGPDIYMPTGFTPNNDGKNDLFMPFTVGIKQINYFKVFNRWGQLLYSTNQLGAGWNGKFNGVDQASGVYVWMVQGVTKDNRIITKKGTIALIR